MKRAFVLTVALSLTGGSAWAFPVRFSPPPSLTLNGQPISQGNFTVTGAVGFSRDGSSILEEIILDQADSQDDVIFNATIGDTTPHLLFEAPEETEVLRMIGFFDATTPNLPNANFDIFAGVRDPSSGASDFTVFLPSNTSTFGFQITDLGSDPGLDDNTNTFSSTEPVVDFSSSFVSGTTSISSGGFTDHGTATAVPEPSSVLGVLAFGAFGAGTLLKRQLKNRKSATLDKSNA